MIQSIYDIKKYIEEAQLVLIGIGQELSARNLIPIGDDTVVSYFDQRGNHYRALLENKKEHEEIINIYYNYYLLEEGYTHIYDILEQMLQGKDYFIVTSNADTLIERSVFLKEHISAPCGDIRLLQCSERCSNLLVDSKDILKRQIEEFESNAYIKPELCPSCKKPLITNIRDRETKQVYVEEGYLKQWNKYTKWIQGTLNKKLLVLELGEGFEQPELFRWPFEKIVYINDKAKLIRVHKSLSQIQEELKEKAIAVPIHSKEFLNTKDV